MMDIVLFPNAVLFMIIQLGSVCTIYHSCPIVAVVVVVVVGILLISYQ